MNAPTERDTKLIKSAWYAANALRPYKVDADILAAIIPPGGEWTCVAPEDAITRSVKWNSTEVCLVNPAGDLGDTTEGDIAMGLRATPVMDTALRVIMKLAADPANNTLITRVAETAIAYVEMPAPKLKEPPEDDFDEDACDEEC